MWKFEHSERTTATPQAIWNIWTDVTNWSVWDNDVKWAKLEGPFKKDSIIRIKPTVGPTSVSVVTVCEFLKNFTNTSKLPLAAMTFEHTIDQSIITHRVTICGPLSFLWGWIIGCGIAEGLPHAMKKLVQLAEQQQ